MWCECCVRGGCGRLAAIRKLHFGVVAYSQIARHPTRTTNPNGQATEIRRVYVFSSNLISGGIACTIKLKAPAMIIGSATVEDVQAIVSIFVSNRSDPGLFQESDAEVRRNLGDFLVARDANGRVVACSGLHRDSAELAEVYGVAVLPELQGQGIGAMLMQKCKERAFASQLTCLWLATVKPEYFRRYSFCTISRWSLPTSVLLRKFRQVFEQPVQRWVPVLFGRHTFMKCDLREKESF